jgi:acetylglutamate kinase
MIDPRTRAQVLTEALPYLRRYAGKTFVIKYGGAAMVDEALKQSVMQDVVLMHYVGLRPVLVHGGGPEITEAMKKTGKEPTFINGLRVTDQETVEIVEMVLAGKTNKGIVALIQRQGGKAVGLSGKDGDLIVARRMRPNGVDIGFVGEVTEVHPELLEILAREGYIPVISSVSVGPEGETLNINADHVAGRIAGELRAEKLLLLTDVAGILADVKDPASLISEMDAARARTLIESGAVDQGMIPKVEACLMALEGGVPRAHILDGRTQHALLEEVFTDSGVGTMIVAG